MNGYSFTFGIILLSLIVGLIYYAAAGVVSAIVTLAVVLTILLVALGAGIALAATRIMGNQAQKAFMDNTAENLGIMRELQSLQNQQNQQLLKQAVTMNRLPKPAAPADLSNVLLIEDGVFAELDR